MHRGSNLLEGLMTKDEFISLATDNLPNPDLKIFASKIFHLYDKNGNGFLDFAEFSSATEKMVSQRYLMIKSNCILQLSC